MHLESNRPHHIIPNREPSTNPPQTRILTPEQVLEILGTPNQEETARQKAMEEWRWQSAQKDVLYTQALSTLVLK